MKIDNIFYELHKIKKSVDNLLNELPRDYCPKCRKPTEYIPNPFYMHTCKECGHDCRQVDLLSIEQIIYGETE